jgi:ABC-2 type transport system ATP-binding protein
MDTQAVIDVEGLRKAYGELVAVDDVSFRARAGEIYGLLGPNGAGKSTSIGCISGLLKPDSGSVRVLGHDVAAVASRQGMGVVPQELAIYEDLSATENLNYWGAAYGLRGSELTRRAAEVLTRVGLDDRGKEPAKQFSGGMKRRLNFACGVVHNPKVLLLDEPTVGVDPQSRVRLLDLVREEAASGTCVLYTTHYMEEAEALCNRLAIIDRGRLIAEGSLAELYDELGARELVRLSGSFDPARVRQVLDAALAGAGTYELVQSDAELVVLSLQQASSHLSSIFSALAGAGAEVRETTLTRPNLESLFIKLTGKELRE